jgi:hypothetical protein
MKNYSLVLLLFVLSYSLLFSQSYQWILKQSGSSLGGPIDVEKFNSNNVY